MATSPALSDEVGLTTIPGTPSTVSSVWIKFGAFRPTLAHHFLKSAFGTPASEEGTGLTGRKGEENQRASTCAGWRFHASIACSTDPRSRKPNESDTCNGEVIIEKKRIGTRRRMEGGNVDGHGLLLL
mmetsp:Transcript_6493/g.14193  ORF Transcript_6493/g.14193 Transcript_6493/m.14193 type:complete len:128 (-) Transcript_6493:40-423(-)